MKHLESDAQHDETAGKLERRERDPKGVQHGGAAKRGPDQDDQDRDRHLDRSLHLEREGKVPGH